METLVIGYGNDLRSDDGAGRVVADRIDALALPGVSVRSLSQLTPELSLEIAGADRVIFVDADIDVARTTVAQVTAAPGDDSAWTHHTTPAALLAMAGMMGEVPGLAYTVSVPVTDLELGTEISPTASAGVAEALDMIQLLISE